MSYVVYHVVSTQAHRQDYKTLGWAQRAAERLNLEEGDQKYRATSIQDYNENVVHKIRVKNLMTNEMVEIDSNTPHCCNPSTETYWSM
jgi:hypothetical protein